MGPCYHDITTSCPDHIGLSSGFSILHSTPSILSRNKSLHTSNLLNPVVAKYPPCRSDTYRLLARGIKDFATDGTDEEVEESGDDSCSRLWTQKVIPLNDMVLAEQNRHWDGALEDEFPLIEAHSVR